MCKGIPDSRARLGIRVSTAHKVQQDQRATQVCKATRVLLDKPGCKAQPG